ncbi:MAG: triose-phosphate isomerase [Deltaproteobacteria bacterium]|jgi:triosephosphate isomerase|nr:triose-phosphate isomerase [Deltaproteobacteria bacterium]
MSCNLLARGRDNVSRTPFLAGNWKMYKTGPEAVAFIEAFKPLVGNLSGREAALGVPATAIFQAAQAAAGTGILIGAQNIWYEKEGAYTGEISAAMAKAAGAGFVIIGHSERRQYYGETDEWVNKKLKAAAAEGLVPVVCVGESLAERESGSTFKVLESQLRGALDGITPEIAKPLVIAYEPVWAIGTGKTATAAQAQEAHAFLRGVLAKALGTQSADAIRILYGGSVKPDNAKALLSEADIDGALVGGAALKPDSFAQIVNFDK